MVANNVEVAARVLAVPVVDVGEQVLHLGRRDLERLEEAELLHHNEEMEQHVRWRHLKGVGGAYGGAQFWIWM